MNFTPKYFIGYTFKTQFGKINSIYQINRDQQFPNLISALSHKAELENSPRGETYKYDVFELRKVT